MNKQIRKEKAIAVIDAMAPELKEISLFLHQHPELGGEEYQAAHFLTQAAQRHGFSLKPNNSGFETAFIAQRGSTGPRIAFLAEYDALPGLGHACGHNLIAAMSFGAAVALAETTGDGAVSYLIGCPAEETVGAKVAMTTAGLFDGLSAAIIVHPAAENTIGGTSYATHPLKVTFSGRPVHVASTTDKGINALDALITFYQELKVLKQTFTEKTILAGIITKGGTAPNIVPAEAEAKFTVRALSAAYLEKTVLPAVRKLAAKVAHTTGTSVACVHYEPLFKELKNNTRLMDFYKNNMSLLGETVTVLAPSDADGSTDVGNVSHVTPTIHPDLGIGCGLVAHTPEFAAAAGSVLAQERLLIGAKAMVMTAIDLLDANNPI